MVAAGACRGDILRVCPLERGAAEDPGREYFGDIAHRSMAAPGATLFLGSAEQAAVGDEGGEVDVRAENEEVKKQLKQALETAQKWQGLHSQLHQFCVEQMLPAASTPG